MANDLLTQQSKLVSSEYDLRITNLARYIYKKIPSKSGTLIDIGAGNGLFLKFFKDCGFMIEGIELEKSQVHQMKQDRKLSGVPIRQGDITQLKGKESFDIVIASDVIEHIEDDVKALRNLFSFVRDGGYLVITVPAGSHLYGKRDIKWGHYRRYDKSTFKTKMKSIANAEIVSLTFWNIPGFFIYFFFEKILKKPVNEKMRYSESVLSRLVRKVVDTELNIETFIGGFPIGLTLIAIIRKNKVM